MNEISFEVREHESEGSFVARALGYSIVTEAETWDELRTNVQDAFAATSKKPRLLAQSDFTRRTPLPPLVRHLVVPRAARAVHVLLGGEERGGIDVADIPATVRRSNVIAEALSAEGGLVNA